MSGEKELDVDAAQESRRGDSSMQENELPDANDSGEENLAKENGTHGGTSMVSEDHDQLLQMVAELKLENDFLKSQFEGLRNQVGQDRSDQKAEQGKQEIEASAELKELYERVASLSRELDEEKLTRVAAEQALEHLREAHSEADAKAQEYAAKFSEVQQKFDREMKEHEEKYADLDAKFNRLHKRAKQRIQDIQKEKDDLEARLREVQETAEQASSHQSSLQQELERTRQQANEALKAMDTERQQLRSANNKLRDTIEELHGSLRPKENTIEALQQSLLDKDRTLEDLKMQLQAADGRRHTALAELSAKHQKDLESKEAQFTDALAERDKAAETISTLQVLVAEKESKIADMEAASTGEAVRLGAAADFLKRELTHLKQQHEQEKESWEAAGQELKTKLEIAESNCLRAEIEVAKMRSQLESEMSMQTQMLSTKEAELKVFREEIIRIESEFSSYKIRAHALLQKKDAELAAATDTEQIKALEEALKDAEREISLVSAERDGARQDLQDALAVCDKVAEERATALKDAMGQIKSVEIKLDSAVARHQAEKQEWEEDLQILEDTWRRRCEALTAQNEASSAEDLKTELEDIKQRNKRLKEENDSLRDLSDRLIEEKDQEISKLVSENKKLQHSLEQRPPINQNDYHVRAGISASQRLDGSNLSTSATEQQILLLARQQAQREEELAQTQRHILALQEEIEELERENRLHSQQEAMLKTELREMERKQKREGVDMTYLKNVILKLLETGEVEALLPVVGMLLQFSPEEMQKCQQAYRSSGEVTPGPGSDGSAISLFSRFSFS